MWKIIVAACFTVLIAMTVYDFSPAPPDAIKMLALKVDTSNSDQAKAQLVDFLKDHPTPTNQELKEVERSIDVAITEKLVADITGTSKVELKPNMDTEITGKMVLFCIVSFGAILMVIKLYFRMRDGDFD